MATSNTKEKPKLTVSPVGRVSFAYVFEKSEMSEKYEVTLIWPDGTDLSALEKLVEETADAKWGKGKWPKNFHSPIRDCEEKEDKDGYDNGGRFARFWRTTRPRVVSREREDDGTFKEITEESGEFYSGCWALVSCNAFAYDKNGNKGVAFGLQNIQKSKDDEPFAGTRSNPEEDFDDLEDALS